MHPETKETDPKIRDVIALADELRGQLNQALMEFSNEPIQAALRQIPAILKREDLSEEQKRKVLRQLQLSVTTPFLNIAVNAGLATGMGLDWALFYFGSAWDAVRAEQMAHVAQEMLSVKKQE